MSPLLSELQREFGLDGNLFIGPTWAVIQQ